MDKAEERIYRLALHYYVHDKNIYTDNFSRKTQYKYQEIMAEVEWKNRSIFYCCCWKEFMTATATITSKKLQNNNSTRASRSIVHFFSVTAGLQRENAQFQV